jgi:hypothetical protein
MQASKLESLLSQHKAAIVQRWFTALLSTYPAEAAKFLRRESDEIANPVGQTFVSEMESLVEELWRGFDEQRLRPHMQAIVRIRAVQDFTPTRALAFVFSLKEAIHDELDRKINGDRALEGALSQFEQRIDQLSLLAFECYVSCKEKMYEIRVDEMRRRTQKLMERMNRLHGEEEEPHGEEEPRE